ncbi:N-formylglutamate deformylase [Roseibium polysiphoniae]|uniref:N-formylglutamate deformylase n=1 Tax=Roseibium polysiphoniae TaxID=2571221 RepID=UPI0032997497
MDAVEVVSGDSPIILSVPHAGTHVPQEVWDTFNETGKELADTDWHVDQLYKGLVPDISIVTATFHRYVIDANRDPSGVSLYPGQNTTTLCPTTDFDGRPIYLDGSAPDEAEIVRRQDVFHAAYHKALASEIARIKTIHGIAVLYDCHSIRSNIPFLFEGTLPDFNVGTNGGSTCAPQIEAAVVARTQRADGYTSILNGRFKGGWTTRHYGRPTDGVHAIQLELAQSTYLETEEPPFNYSQDRASSLRPYLQSILQDLNTIAGELAPKKQENALRRHR